MNWKLHSLARFQDFTLLIMRVATGAFLMHETWDNIVSSARMAEFAEFLSQFGFPVPHLMAPLSVAVQFICGIMLVLGLTTRIAGMLIAANFAVALYMVHWAEPFREWWPALILILLGLHFSTAGSGRFGFDGAAGKRR